MAKFFITNNAEWYEALKKNIIKTDFNISFDYSSKYVCALAVHKLSMENQNSVHEDDDFCIATGTCIYNESLDVKPILDEYNGDVGMLSPDDILLAISYSGNTDKLLRILPPVLERKIPIIAISSDSQSLLGKNSVCHLTIKVEREADPLNLAPTSSTTATMAMGDALACALVHVRNFKDADFARFHPGGLWERNS